MTWDRKHADKLVEWFKPWTKFEAKIPTNNEPSTHKLFSWMGEALIEALAEIDRLEAEIDERNHLAMERES